MLSILIPTYNYDVTALVKNLQQQCLKINGLVFEVLVYDDGSSLFREENRYINSLEYCSFTLLDKNIGRSAIRNMLARNASYENLLFLDADVQLIKNEFISDYLKVINEKEHFEVSQKVAELVLFPTLRKTGDEYLIAAAGTSCRHQIKDGLHRPSFHPVEIIYEALIKK